MNGKLSGGRGYRGRYMHKADKEQLEADESKAEYPVVGVSEYRGGIILNQCDPRCKGCAHYRSLCGGSEEQEYARYCNYLGEVGKLRSTKMLDGKAKKCAEWISKKDWAAVVEERGGGGFAIGGIQQRNRRGQLSDVEFAASTGQEWLTEACRRTGMSNSRIAEALGIETGSFQGAIYREKCMSDELMQKLGAFLGYSDKVMHAKLDAWRTETAARQREKSKRSRERLKQKKTESGNRYTWIRNEAQRVGVKIKDIASACGKSYSCFNEYIVGAYAMKDEQIKVICGYLDISREEFDRRSEEAANESKL